MSTPHGAWGACEGGQDEVALPWWPHIDLHIDELVLYVIVPTAFWVEKLVNLT